MTEMDFGLEQIQKYELPDFETALLFSIVAKKNFLVLFDAEQRKLNDEITNEELIQKSVGDVMQKRTDFKINFKYQCINHVTDEMISEIQKCELDDYKNLETMEHVDEKGDRSANIAGVDQNVTIEFYLVEDIDRQSLADYYQLGRLMREGYIFNVQHNGIANNKKYWKLFIGTVAWKRDEYIIPDDILQLGAADKKYSHKHGQSFKLKSFSTGFEDWIRHKFWLVTTLAMPNIKPVIEVQAADDTASFSSVVITKDEAKEEEAITGSSDGAEKIISGDYKNYDNIHIQASLRRYILDIMVHIRTHRLTFNARGGGIHKNCYSNMITLSKIICIKDHKSFVVPQHVRLAAMWFLPLQLSVIDDSLKDNSILYGSKPELVRELMKRVVYVRNKQIIDMDNPLFMEALIVKSALKKIVPPV